MISQRIRDTLPPPLLELGSLARNTEDTISLGQGVPYYQPEEKYFNQVFKDFKFSDFHHYTQDPGIFELRNEISSKIQSDFGLTVDPNLICVTNGANQAYVNSLLTITDPGDKIGLITPYYFNHKMAATFSNVETLEIDLNPDYSLSQENIEKAILLGIKAIILVNPGNPTGIVHTENEQKMLADLVEDKNIWIISDETYEYFIYSGKYTSTSTINKIRNQIITITSFSKTFGIPGWRLGYYYGPEEFVNESLKVQDTTTICAPAPTQFLGVNLLKNRNSIIPIHKELMRGNHKLATDLLEEVSWLDSMGGNGAYYLFPQQTTGKNTGKLAYELITNHKVALVPGSAFGSNYKDYFRISFANVQEEQLKEAFARLKNVK